MSGNVSLYNETNGRAILPTPTIGGVGVLDDFTKSMTIAFKSEGQSILLIGETDGWLGQSVYLRDICGLEEGAPPPIDLAAERRHGEFVRSLIRDRVVTAVHDVSDGGLLVALAEMAMARIGAVLEAIPGTPAHALLVRRGSGAIRRDRAGRRRSRAARKSRHGAVAAPGRDRRPHSGVWRRAAASH